MNNAVHNPSLTPRPDAPLVFAAAPYLNAAPLTEAMRNRSDVTLIEQAPSTLSALLASGRADAALVPVVDLLYDADLAMIGGLGVSADGKVASVLLECDGPPAAVKRLAGDPRSHTSNLLAQLLLRDHWKSRPDLICDESGTPDATVIIGDRALCLPVSGKTRYDMAETWQQMTGLPFVFAVWACRKEHPYTTELTRLATEAYAQGRQACDAIGQRFAAQLKLSPEFCRDYLVNNIDHIIGEREQIAIQTFRRLLKKHRLTLANKDASA
ncbi:MAG: menaquinone biosynthesis protein [Kiritimatiellia bacterium]|nr:menaquinone biosynthesis protein [Kiritimatiellia bacterium]MDP6810713.1 menaquinone biosynthesis protein [Kiritimatiellia bacterium]MDP7023300.1 menaquinone biosynthesis protein [Kiritimatiellia bacterium]